MASGVEKLSARTIIVGSGPGGATVAHGLARRGEDVLMLEGGGLPQAHRQLAHDVPHDGPHGHADLGRGDHDGPPADRGG